MSAPVTPETLTDEMIRELERLDLCGVCGSGMLAPSHHNELMSDHHMFSTGDREVFVTALYEFDYPTARLDARQRICDAINARKEGK